MYFQKKKYLKNSFIAKLYIDNRIIRINLKKLKIILKIENDNYFENTSKYILLLNKYQISPKFFKKNSNHEWPLCYWFFLMK